MSMGLGVNIHLGYGTTGYADQARVFSGIDSVGFTYVRENTAAGIKALKDRYGSAVIVIGPAGNGAVAKAMLEAGVDVLEGPNELFTKKKIVVSPTKTITSAADIAAYAVARWNEVYDAREAFTRATGRRVPLASTSASLGDAAWAKQVATVIGKLAKQPDIQSHHVYPGNRTVAQFVASLRTSKAVADILCPGLPRWLTETGSWWDDDPKIRAASGHVPTAPSDAIALWPQYLAAAEAEGFAVSFMYELIDEWVNGAPKGTVANRDVQEGRLGVLTRSFADKPWTPVIRAEAHTRNTRKAVTAIPWAVEITPDPTPRWKAVQTRVEVTPDGLVGNDTLTAIEKMLDAGDALAVENESLKQRLAGIAKMASGN